MSRGAPYVTGKIVVDARGRTSLARVRTRGFTEYTVTEHEDGTLVLTPVITISPVEYAALQNPEVRAAIERAKTGDRADLRTRPAPAPA
jgi:hypothetical protein